MLAWVCKLKILTVWKRLCQSLTEEAPMLWYLLPTNRRVKRLRLGGWRSIVMLGLAGAPCFIGVLCEGTVGIPHSDAGGQDALIGPSEQHGEDIRSETHLLQLM